MVSPLSLLSFRLNKPSSFSQPSICLLYSLHQLHCFSLSMCQQLNIFLVARGPKLSRILQLWSLLCQVQWDNYFLSSAGHTVSDTNWDVTGLLGHTAGSCSTLLAHVQLVVNKHPQVLLCWEIFQPLFHISMQLHDGGAAQVQDTADCLIDCHTNSCSWETELSSLCYINSCHPINNYTPDCSKTYSPGPRSFLILSSQHSTWKICKSQDFPFVCTCSEWFLLAIAVVTSFSWSNHSSPQKKKKHSIKNQEAIAGSLSAPHLIIHPLYITALNTEQ